ncbi:MAG: ABC transporter ATP-binding protein [Pseudomonadales bacterium]|nr:ABC transporter ATP-binding protein [Pseudomonadales bacterium]
MSVEILNVSKSFGDTHAVQDVSLTIEQGEIFALLGGSGCGKTTLLRMLAGFESPDSGDVRINGESILALPPFHRHVNMMFQSYALFPHMTVEKNIAFGPAQDGLSKQEIAERVDEVLELVQMERYRKRKPAQLSGGQQQRIALARSLAKKPSLLLLDEPMAALDKKLRMRMQLELVSIVEQVGVTCIIVTHDQEEAMTMSNRIAIMDAGRIRQVGTPQEIYEYPNSRMTAEFVGSINLLPATVTACAESTTLQLKDAASTVVCRDTRAREGEAYLVAIRPEKVALSTEDEAAGPNCLRGVIDDIAYLGSHSVVHVRLENGKIMQAHMSNVSRDARTQIDFEQPVTLSWEPESVLLISEDD